MGGLVAELHARSYTRIVTRLLRLALALGFCAAALGAQKQKPAEPVEEDESLIPKEYSFNPLQAEKELKVGGFYFRKGSYRAAARRFQEAAKWNPGFAEAYLRLGEAQEKLKDKKAAREAYAKFLELAPDDKRGGEVKRRLQRLGSASPGGGASPPASRESPSPSRGTDPRTEVRG